MPAASVRAEIVSTIPRAPRGGPVRAALSMLCLAVLALAGVATAPEPDAVPRRWQLELEPGQLRIAAARVGDNTRYFYYFTYTVTNNSGEDRFLAPAWELATDTGEVTRSGRDVPPEVTNAVKDSLQNILVDDQVAIIGNLLQGKENAKTGVVIWPVGDMSPNEVTIYGAGYS